ncbi:MAG: family 78 glycoside hydrolase catalytic domain, partial [Clostridiales bacterium]|nr:family 78 glycoside hydrolase catalytic domain [Clostridiales bacterium]
MINNKVKLTGLKCENMYDPIGIDLKIPRLSWELLSQKRGTRQTAWQVAVAESGDALKAFLKEVLSAENGKQKTDVTVGTAGTGILWDSGKITSDSSCHVPYSGPEPESGKRYWWMVRIWDEMGTASEWSEPAFWEMGLLDRTDWKAKWIEPVQEPATLEVAEGLFQKLAPVPVDFVRDYTKLMPSQFLRKKFEASGELRRARIYATAHGVYRLELNGLRVGDRELAPEVSVYDKYLQYQTYDVTEMVKSGANAIGAVIGDGWYCGRLGLPGDSCQYGDRLALLLQLELEYADGSRQTIVSDDSFRSATGPLVFSDLFIGERYDARLEIQGWSTADFDDSDWQNVMEAGFSPDNLVAQYGEPVRAVEEIKPVSIITTPKGETVIDLGQNIAGRVRMKVAGPAGTEIMLEHSEVLDAGGNFLMNILGRNKDQKDFYVLKGGCEEIYEPWFTFHGFRYVRVTGYPGEIGKDTFTGVVLASDLKHTGSFECSDERINKLQKNIQWSQKGNMLSIPTDCPQRERAGFTGDAQVFIPTACFNMDVLDFFKRWLANLALEQKEDGQVPTNVPYWKSYAETFFPMQKAHTSAGWGDACIIVPWVLYNSYGDESVLRDNYSTMEKWIKYIKGQAETGIPENLEGEMTPERRERQKYLWNTGFQFGDWLIPSMTAGYGNPFESANATKELITCCFYGYCTELMAEIASVLGLNNDAV